MAISKKLLNYLSESKYKYEVIEHRTTYTAWDTSQTEKVKPQEVGKALVFKAGKDWILALLPANRNADAKKLLKLVNANRKKQELDSVKKLEFAKEAWMKKNVPGKLGAVPPFKSIIKTDIYIDNGLAKNKKIYLGSGEYTESIRVPVSEYLKKEKPIKGNFSVKK